MQTCTEKLSIKVDTKFWIGLQWKSTTCSSISNLENWCTGSIHNVLHRRTESIYKVIYTVSKLKSKFKRMLSQEDRLSAKMHNQEFIKRATSQGPDPPYFMFILLRFPSYFVGIFFHKYWNMISLCSVKMLKKTCKYLNHVPYIRWKIN